MAVMINPFHFVANTRLFRKPLPIILQRAPGTSDSPARDFWAKVGPDESSSAKPIFLWWLKYPMRKQM